MVLPADERTTILLVEDDRRAATTLKDVLEADGYRVWCAESGAEAKAIMGQNPPDLVILDLGLPDVDGLVLCSALKAITDVPIIICSGTPHQRDTVIGLRLGADDFVRKPFDVDDLLARVEAVLRRVRRSAPQRPSPPPAELVEIGDLTIDHVRRRVTLGGETVPLTPTEYRLLRALALRVDQILTRDELAEEVWGTKDGAGERAIDVYIRRLRVKLSQGPVAAPPIVSARGFGYSLAPRAADSAAPA